MKINCYKYLSTQQYSIAIKKNLQKIQVLN